MHLHLRMTGVIQPIYTTNDETMSVFSLWKLVAGCWADQPLLDFTSTTRKPKIPLL